MDTVIKQFFENLRDLVDAVLAVSPPSQIEEDAFRLLNERQLKEVKQDIETSVSSVVPPIQRPKGTGLESGRRRQAAFLAGHEMFDSGSPCKYGHPGIRYTSSGTCVICKQNLRPIKPNSPVHREKAQSMGELFDIKMSKERRNEARRKHERFYFAVRPCPNGHHRRYVSNNACQECELVKRKERANGLESGRHLI